jgi:hypothetical protein
MQPFYNLSEVLEYRGGVFRPYIYEERQMMAEFLHYYILFQNHTDATAMYRSLKGKGMYAQISPTPRELSVCCGVSLLIHGEDVDRIKEIAEAENLAYLSISGLNNTFDNTRHKYG